MHRSFLKRFGFSHHKLQRGLVARKMPSVLDPGKSTVERHGAAPSVSLKASATNGSFLRFGVFELCLTSGELRKAGTVLRLPPQPFRILALLATQAGQTVTREAIQQEIWGGETFVDFEQGLNFAINKIRTTLGDNADSPRYIQTLPRRGYRFIASVEAVGGHRDVLGQDSEEMPHPLQSSSQPADALVKSQSGSPERDGSSQQHTAQGGVVSKNRSFLRRLSIVFGLAVILVLAAIWTSDKWRTLAQAHAGPPHITSIAVLPLDNLSSDRDLGYFADGLTDELTANLAKIRSLYVISRTTMRQYPGSGKALPQIAKELHVDAVVEGSVVRSGSTVRITVQLIDGHSDRDLWVQPYEREVNETLKLKVQDWIALDVASQIKAKLVPEQHGSFRGAPVKPEALEAYLRGQSQLGKQSAEAIKNSMSNFQHAIEVDPSFAPAYSGLSDTYSLLASYGALPPREAFPQAKAAATKALELDPSLGEAHVSLGFVKSHYEWDWAGADREYKRAIELNPAYAIGHLRYSRHLSMLGRHDEAIAEIKRAEELDLLCLVIKGYVGQTFYYARRYDPAIEQLRNALEIDPGRIYARIFLARSYEQKRMYPESMREFEKARDNSNPAPSVGLARIYAVSGRPLEARRILKQLEKPKDEAEWFLIAGGYAALGEKDHAFDCLEKAYQKHDFFLPFLKVDPYMDPLRSDARFTSLLQRIGLLTQGSSAT
jgi:TolB-like protein/DNA-binding winged helix-turn-helix (wHTH) protein/tetratricopeptide (TPR) repeat protein